MAWYDEVFDGIYDIFCLHHFTESRNRQEAEFIRKALKLNPGMKVLDIPCGHGRHAVLLAKTGIHVTGIDKSERYIRKAREEAHGLPTEFMVCDIRKLDIQNRFDAAYCFFTSFGFFDDNTNFDILRRIASALKPGGKFLIDLPNKEQVYTAGSSQSQEHIEFEQEGIEVTVLSDSEYHPETGVVDVKLRLYGLPDGPLNMNFSLRIYTLPELRWLLGQVGLEIIRTYGDSEGSAYSMSSQRCIAVALKSSEVVM